MKVWFVRALKSQLFSLFWNAVLTLYSCIIYKHILFGGEEGKTLALPTRIAFLLN